MKYFLFRPLTDYCSDWTWVTKYFWLPGRCYPSTRTPREEQSVILVSTLMMGWWGSRQTWHGRHEIMWSNVGWVELLSFRREILNFLIGISFNLNFEIEMNCKLSRTDWLLLPQLGRLAESDSLEEVLFFCDGYNPARNEFFFNRRHRNFEEILEFYRSGSLHVRKRRLRFISHNFPVGSFIISGAR